jgi:hypothetical protein
VAVSENNNDGVSYLLYKIYSFSECLLFPGSFHFVQIANILTQNLQHMYDSFSFRTIGEKSEKKIMFLTKNAVAFETKF